MARSTRWLTVVAAASILALGIWTATGASATPVPGSKPAPVTKITFKLDPHEVTLGTAVTSSVLVQTHSANTWIALPGATLTVTVDGAPIGTFVTDAAGRASVSNTATTVGGHVMKVLYAGDATHKTAQRAQGFTVDAPQPSPSP